MKQWKQYAWLAAALIVVACASSPQASRPQSPWASEAASRAASNALLMIGKPYRPAGNTPAGFDCSGLVHYSYGQAGVDVPRDTQTLRQVGRSVRTSELRRGDLLFFDQDGKKLSHVGIYLEDERFVHAPSSGGRVRTDSLSATYWSKHFVEARRL